jgi:alkylhydroperoxidase family enzyme
LLEDRASDATPFEHALVELTRKATAAPAELCPADLDALRALKGDSAVDYALVVGAFHFINRIADLLDVPSEGLPERLRRVEFVRRAFVRIASRLMRAMDLANRSFDRSFEEVLADVDALQDAAGCSADRSSYQVFRARPQGLEVVRWALEERDRRSSLDPAVLARVHQVVEEALPAGPDDAFGLHPRPSDPVDAFAFVGTRYAARTTQEMVDALRATGMDDVGIMDLAIAVSDANQWARMSRLLGVDPALYYLHTERAEAVDEAVA